MRRCSQLSIIWTVTVHMTAAQLDHLSVAALTFLFTQIKWRSAQIISMHSQCLFLNFMFNINPSREIFDKRALIDFRPVCTVGCTGHSVVPFVTVFHTVRPESSTLCDCYTSMNVSAGHLCLIACTVKLSGSLLRELSTVGWINIRLWSKILFKSKMKNVLISQMSKVDVRIPESQDCFKVWWHSR